MSRSEVTLTPEELVTFHECLSSKICTRIFKTLLKHHVLNISAISRYARCTNKDANKHLKNLSTLRIVDEDFFAGRHTYTITGTEFTGLMDQAIQLVEART
jgi:hypothetical protein